MGDERVCKKVLIYFLCLCVAYFNRELITHISLIFILYKSGIICVILYCFYVPSGLLTQNCCVRFPKPKICSVLLFWVIKAVTLPFDQTNKAEDFRILIKNHLPVTTFSLSLQATTLLIQTYTTLLI